MSAVVKTIQCYPEELEWDWLHHFGRAPTVKPQPDHEHCPGGHHVEGLLGGWECPCPCHRGEL